ncbi:MAG: DNA polymerase III subunit delta [Nannocystaceae bacterium]
MSTSAAVVLLWGPDRGAIRDALASLRASVLGEKGSPGASLSAFNHERFDAPYIKSFLPVLRACGQMPMMADRRLVEVSDPEEVAKHAKGQDDDGSGRRSSDPLTELLAYIQSPNAAVVLVITSSGVKSTSKLVKAVQASGSGEVRRFEAPNQRAAVARLAQAALEQGRRIDGPAANALVQAVGTSWDELRVALDRALAHADDQQVGVHDVEAVVVDTSSADVFALTDAVGSGNTTRALQLLAAMFPRGEQDVGASQRLFGLLVRHLRLLFTAHVTGRDAPRALGLPPFIAHKYVDQARRTDDARLRVAYAGLARLDGDFKGNSSLGSRLPYLLLQRWILDVCGGLEHCEPR